MGSFKKTLKRIEKSPLSIFKKPFAWFLLVLSIIVIYDFCYLNGYLFEVENPKLPDLVNDVMIETHGLLFDLFIFGLIIYWFKKRETTTNAFKTINSWKRRPESTSIESVLNAIDTLNNQGITAIGLDYVDFTNIDLSNIDLSKGRLKGAILTKAVLKNLILKDTDLRGQSLMMRKFMKGG